MLENALGMITGMTLGLCIVLAVMIGRIKATLSRVESRVEALLKQSGIDPKAEAMARVTELARAGKKIEAIRLLRTETGCSLADAKEQIEAVH